MHVAFAFECTVVVGDDSNVEPRFLTPVVGVDNVGVFIIVCLISVPFGVRVCVRWRAPLLRPVWR